MIVLPLYIIYSVLSLCYAAGPMVITCYYKLGDPPVSLVNATLCSHIILIGESPVDGIGRFTPPSNDVTKQFNSIKITYPDVKLLISVTGKSLYFSKLVSSTSTISAFANTSGQYLRENGLDGLDIDWEFPVWSAGSKKDDRRRLTMLFKAIRENFRKTLLLTTAVSGPPTITRVAYDTAGLNKYVDLVQVMNYDFHVFSLMNPLTGFNAPLHKMKREPGVLAQMNSEASMTQWANQGLWKNKTVFGLPTYSTAFRLFNAFVHRPYSLATGAVEGYSKRAVICDLLTHPEEYTYAWSEEAASPYVYGGEKLWISIEDERSLTIKTEYAKLLGITGVMIFHIGADDYYGSCGNGTYPLINTIYSVIHNNSTIN